MENVLKFSGIKILIAEDCDFNQEIFKEMLELMGLASDIAENGNQALEMIKKNSYDLVLLDIHMPQKDGFTVAKEVRQLKIKQPKIVAISASILEGEKKLCFEAGMDDFLSKPIELKDFAKALQKHFPSKIVQG